ncbi:DUF3987 domain-containing protein [Pseudomonas indica]|uniref:DUF3987 domain-containing protein n=1 Tax=Pseudomonas indica TaxID=137658 RepID=UPI0023F63941|nr:DUF3987 domain-containing protein [Pseudomonas indica]MBU3055843.1 DUF3987 domain-containing protein [Pseudomonas indica]
MQNDETRKAIEAFAELAALSRWVPWFPKTLPGRKPGKVPSNGQRKLSTNDPAHWMPLTRALALASEWADLQGVGIVMTGGVEIDGWRLVGLDFDDVDADWRAPFDSYCEISPSGEGRRQFAWAPVEALEGLADTTAVAYPGCSHVEIYVGTSARFLTITFTGSDGLHIARLEGGDVATLQGMLRPAKAPSTGVAVEIYEGGVPVDFRRIDLTPDQRHLVDGTGKIDRSEVLHGLLIKLVDGGHSQEDILATLTQTPALWDYCLSHRNNDPTKALVFAREEIARAYSRSNAALRDRLIGLNPKWQQEQPFPPATASAFPPPFPGPMADAVAAYLKVAPKPQPDLTTAAMMSAMAASCGSFYRLPSGGRLNLYMLCLAPSGGGKALPLGLANRVGGLGSNARVIGTPGSWQGLEDALLSNKTTYCVLDEIAHLIAAWNDAGATATDKQTIRMLLALFSAGGGEFKGRALAGKDQKVIQHPALNLIGFTTPEKLGSAFSPDDFADGLAGRFLFVFTEADPPLRRMRVEPELPRSVEKTAQRIAGQFMLLLGKDAGTVIGIDEGADRLLDALLTEFDQYGRNSGVEWKRALGVRSLEKAERIAGVLAVWSNPARPVITSAHVNWAAQFVRASNAAVLRFIEKNVHGGDVQANAAKLLDMIRDGKTPTDENRPGERNAHGKGLVPRSALLRRSKLDVRMFDLALGQLMATGDVIVGTVPTESIGGRGPQTRVVALPGQWQVLEGGE